VTISPNRTHAADVEIRTAAETDILGWWLYQTVETKTSGFASPQLLGFFSVTPRTLFLNANRL
jgi:hypothetical protein